MTELTKDNTLGLLLHGTSVVGFCSPDAEGMGWCVGDQIVEVNGQRVASFDDFLACFQQAREQGLPVDFSVLRREQVAADAAPAESAIDDFFSAMDISDMAGRLSAARSRGKPDRLEPPGGRAVEDEESERYFMPTRETSITENPYIQALRKRREELTRDSDTWTNQEFPSSIAAMLASRDDGMSQLRAIDRPLPSASIAVPASHDRSGHSARAALAARAWCASPRSATSSLRLAWTGWTCWSRASGARYLHGLRSKSTARGGTTRRCCVGWRWRPIAALPSEGLRQGAVAALSPPTAAAVPGADLERGSNPTAAGATGADPTCQHQALVSARMTSRGTSRHFCYPHDLHLTSG